MVRLSKLIGIAALAATFVNCAEDISQPRRHYQTSWGESVVSVPGDPSYLCTHASYSPAFGCSIIDDLETGLHLTNNSSALAAEGSPYSLLNTILSRLSREEQAALFTRGEREACEDAQRKYRE